MRLHTDTHFINVKLEQQACNTCGSNTASPHVLQSETAVSERHTYTICTNLHIHTLTHTRTQAGIVNNGRFVLLAGILNLLFVMWRRADRIHIRLLRRDR